MILSDTDIRNLLESEELIISPSPMRIECSHVDLHLGDFAARYPDSPEPLDLREPTQPVEQVEIPETGYILQPSEFLLAHTLEFVSIPNGYFAFIETKGNIARAGIQAHNADGHIDPGFHGEITLELKNQSHRAIRIYPSIAIVQLYIQKTSSPSDAPYDGKYQGQRGPTPYHGDHHAAPTPRDSD